MIAVDSAHLPRPRVGDDEIAGRFAFENGAARIDDLRHNPEEGARRGARLQVRRAW
ncbi:hypothetical protein D3C83_181990 [compost metagenome]